MGYKYCIFGYEAFFLNFVWNMIYSAVTGWIMFLIICGLLEPFQMFKEKWIVSFYFKVLYDVGHDLDFTNHICIFNLLDTDSMVDTFYAIGLVMQLCQSISLLELLHIYVGIESSLLFPRFLQVGIKCNIIIIIDCFTLNVVLFITSFNSAAVKKCW